MDRTHTRSRALLLLTLSLVLSPTFAQEANIWYFGENAGLDFNGGVPVVLLDGAMVSFEGCSSICDGNGDLLFYSNGGPHNSDVGAVWDSTHAIMPNGDLAAGNGCSSSAQACLIVQDPGNADHYYVFTTDCQENSMVGGLRYNEVDMTLNGGNGDVTSIGNLLQPSVNESLIGIRHANGTDVWVLVHGLNNSNYHAFLVTGTGITGPVTTTIGPSVGQVAGQLAANVTGTKVHYAGTFTSSLLDFDTNTGTLSNFIDLQQGVFGGAFARGCRYLYTDELSGSQRVFQYDLLAPDVQASEQVIGTGTALLQANMQLGPDGKIYMARIFNLNLGVINHPDLPGIAADFQENGVNLGGRESLGGLPNFVNDLLGPCNQGPSTGVTEGPPPLSVQCVATPGSIEIQTGNAMSQGSYAVFRSDGVLVHESALAGASTIFKTEQLGSGLYILRVTSKEGRVGTTSFTITQ